MGFSFNLASPPIMMNEVDIQKTLMKRPDCHTESLCKPTPCLLVLGERGEIRDASRDFASSLGRPHREIVGALLADLVVPSQRAKAESFLANPAQQGAAGPLTLTFRVSGDREWEVCLFTSRLENRLVVTLTSPDSQAAVERTVLRDTKQQEIHADLARLTDSNAPIADSIDCVIRWMTEQIRDAVWIYDPANGHVIYSNPAFVTVWGLKPDILAENGEAWSKWVEPGHRPSVEKHLEQLRMGKPFDEEFHLNPPDGGLRWIRCRCFPVMDAEGCATSVVAVAEDITIRRNAELARSQLERQIHHAAEKERRSIARDLHDSLGSLLSAIQLRIEVLRDEVAKERLPGMEDVTVIADLTKQAVSGIRSMTRGLSPVGTDPYDLNAALEGLVRETRKHSPIDISLHLPEPVSIGSQEVASQLFRIAQEAITNAVKHSDANRLVIGLVHKEGSILLTVEDDGRGFDPPDDNGGNRPPGGLGLGIMTYRARDIGAELSIGRGENGRGTRLTCSLPEECVSVRKP